MIKVTRINNEAFYINPDQIDFIEETPNTVITLTNGKKVIVEESANIIVEKIVEYKRRIFIGLPPITKQED